VQLIVSQFLTGNVRQPVCLRTTIIGRSLLSEIFVVTIFPDLYI
jgi:hypothetical protein